MGSGYFAGERDGMTEYELIRSARRTMALEITRDCRIIVRAPMRVSKKQIDEFVVKHADWIAAHMGIQEKRREAHPEPTAQEQEMYIQRAKDELPGKVAKYSKIMNLYPAGITITGARKRFGSCSGKNRICFSWRLMAYPEAAIDYVVVHELAHILHKDHSKAFYACIEQVLPDWRERQKLLRE